MLPEQKGYGLVPWLFGRAKEENSCFDGSIPACTTLKLKSLLNINYYI